MFGDRVLCRCVLPNVTGVLPLVCKVREAQFVARAANPNGLCAEVQRVMRVRGRLLKASSLANAGFT